MARAASRVSRSFGQVHAHQPAVLVVAPTGLAVLMATVDASIVNLALPAIGAEGAASGPALGGILVDTLGWLLGGEGGGSTLADGPDVVFDGLDHRAAAPGRR